jgi:hypothetical protein
VLSSTPAMPIIAGRKALLLSGLTAAAFSIPCTSPSGGGGRRRNYPLVAARTDSVVGPLLAARALPLRCAASAVLSSTLAMPNCGGRKALLLSGLTAVSAFRTAGVTLVPLDKYNLWLRIDVCVGIIAFDPLPSPPLRGLILRRANGTNLLSQALLFALSFHSWKPRLFSLFCLRYRGCHCWSEWLRREGGVFRGDLAF